MTVQSGSRVRIPVFPQKSPNLYNINKLGENYNRKRDKTGTSIYSFDFSLSEDSGQVSIRLFEVC